jgi:hypothetical protein
VIEFLKETDRRGSHLIVAFTGVSQGLGGIPFEFRRSLGEVSAEVIFVRDTGQRWYQYDLAMINQVVRRINETAAAIGATRVSCLGNSMGGFGALMFGSLCAADAVLAFAPQSTIDPRHTAAMGDHRWLEYQRNIEVYPLPDLNTLPAPKGSVTIHYGGENMLDIAHAERLHWPAERVIHPGCQHDVAKALRERGELTASIRGGLKC